MWDSILDDDDAMEKTLRGLSGETEEMGWEERVEEMLRREGLGLEGGWVDAVVRLVEERRGWIEKEREWRRKAEEMDRDGRKWEDRAEKWKAKAEKLEKEVEAGRLEMERREDLASRERKRRDAVIDEMKVSLAKVTQRENFMLVEMKKKEEMYSKLQDRLGHLLGKRGSSRKPGMAMNRPVEVAVEDEDEEDDKGAVNAFIHHVASSYRFRHHTLLEENDRLKTMLHNVQTELAQTLNALKTPRKSLDDGSGEQELSIGGDSESPVVSNPRRIDSIERGLSRKLARLRERMKRRTLDPDSSSETVRSLSEEVRECHLIIEEQEDLIRCALSLRGFDVAVDNENAEVNKLSDEIDKSVSLRREIFKESPSEDQV